MEEDEPESGGWGVVLWETLLQMLGLSALLAIILFLLSPTFRKAIFDAVAHSVADLAVDLAYKIVMKFIQVLCRLKIRPRLISLVSIYILGFDIFFYWNQLLFIYKFLFSDLGIIDYFYQLLLLIDLSSNYAYPTIWIRAFVEFLKK
ncbi:unnamed protein product [Spirodela intermedia]|uniref:Uncharacterized protein n=1 Tax=Spirodela intermedia TaxID=51605 RepID=A0A7I8JZE2_SPIIN|nr:unnamed protein product [Spirodela intermedia]